MEMKLLHERLRELPEGSFYDELGEAVGIGWKPEGELLGDYFDRLMPALADEIEKYYLPRPCFEDGEPVDFGCEFIDHNGNNQTVSSLTYTTGKSDYVTINGWDRKVLSANLKRPEHKVLDADGVEIKVGDTVWHVTGIYPWKVLSVNSSGVLVRDKTLPDGECGGMFVGSDLTHKEPDSLDKLLYDVSKVAGEGTCDWLEALSFIGEVEDRLAAIMERDAK